MRCRRDIRVDRKRAIQAGERRLGGGGREPRMLGKQPRVHDGQELRHGLPLAGHHGVEPNEQAVPVAARIGDQTRTSSSAQPIGFNPAAYSECLLCRRQKKG